MKINATDLPGLYQYADDVSGKMQRTHYKMLAAYSILLFIGSLFAFLAIWPDAWFKIIAACLFLGSLSVLIWRQLANPEAIWYNSRALAESIKTRAWRFMMKASPYDTDDQSAYQEFVNDLKEFLQQNINLVNRAGVKMAVRAPVSSNMQAVRQLSIHERLEFYKRERIDDQENWYVKKASFNKRMSDRTVTISVVLHAIAIFLLLYNIKAPLAKFPVSVIGVAASGLLGWVQAKKYGELFSSYSLTAHEISVLKSEPANITTEEQLSNYVMNSETAFSREHTQWIARKRT